MNEDVIILIAEDDDGHAALVERNIKRAGVINQIIRFKNGEEARDFLFRKEEGKKKISGESFLLLLDIRMPKLDGVEVLRQIKEDSELKNMPVIMVTTTDDPNEIDRCHELGCDNYIIKPVDYGKFVQAIKQLGFFLKVEKATALSAGENALKE